MWSRSGADESKRRAAIPAVTLSGGERDPRGQRRILLVPGPGLSRGLAQRRQPSRESRPRDPQRGGSPRLDLLRGDRERRDGAGRAGIAQDPAVELPLGSVDPRVGPQDRCQRRGARSLARDPGPPPPPPRPPPRARRGKPPRPPRGVAP